MKNMTAMNAKRKQAGFTIIELVVVILLLGILTATALPRFMDVTDEAHAAVVDAIEGGLATGTALFRAQWVAEGQPYSTAVTEFTLFASSVTGVGKTAGYPKGDAVTIDATACLDIYNSVLQPGGRPIAEAITTVNAVTPANLEAAVEGAAATTIVAARLEQAAAIADSSTCHYYYIGQYRSGTTGAGNSRIIPSIVYDMTTGSITRSSLTLQL
jgi:MSHA pilin protein MshB